MPNRAFGRRRDETSAASHFRHEKIDEPVGQAVVEQLVRNFFETSVFHDKITSFDNFFLDYTLQNLTAVCHSFIIYFEKIGF